MKWHSRHGFAIAGGLLLAAAVGIVVSRNADEGLVPDGPDPARIGLSPEAGTALRASERSPASARRVREESEFHIFAQRAIKELPKLTRAEAELFLEARGRNAASLACAFRQTGDEAYILEALDRFPEDPEVLAAALMSRNFKPENRGELIERLKSVEPDNVLGDYLGAIHGFAEGNAELALAELRNGLGKPYRDFSELACQTDEEAFVTAGYDPLEAKLAANRGTSKAATFDIQGMLMPMKELRQRAMEENDEATLAAIHEVKSGIARQMAGNSSPCDQIVGWVYEISALRDIGTEEADFEIQNVRQRMKDLGGPAGRVDELLADPAVSPTDWTFYFDRVKHSGEAAANEWLLERYD